MKTIILLDFRTSAGHFHCIIKCTASCYPLEKPTLYYRDADNGSKNTWQWQYSKHRFLHFD